MTTLVNALHALWRDDEGQDLIEYALIGGLVALVAVAAITTSGKEVNRIWTNISDALTQVPNP
jgi:Flp pilus assembly pilin Flp